MIEEGKDPLKVKHFIWGELSGTEGECPECGAYVTDMNDKCACGCKLNWGEYKLD